MQLDYLCQVYVRLVSFDILILHFAGYSLFLCFLLSMCPLTPCPAITLPHNRYWMIQNSNMYISVL